jgi:hypothetical protein
MATQRAFMVSKPGGGSTRTWMLGLITIRWETGAGGASGPTTIDSSPDVASDLSRSDACRE